MRCLLFGQRQVSAAQNSCELLAASIHSSWQTDVSGRTETWEGINSTDTIDILITSIIQFFFFTFSVFYQGLSYSPIFPITNIFFFPGPSTIGVVERKNGIRRIEPAPPPHTHTHKHTVPATPFLEHSLLPQ